jgi:hypothetical protein
VEDSFATSSQGPSESTAMWRVEAGQQDWHGG